jgi:hypothetical protein
MDRAINRSILQRNTKLNRKVYISAYLIFFMEIPQIQKILIVLDNSLDKIKALLAWEQLKLAEARPGDHPEGFLPDSTEADLRNQYSNFLFISLQAHNLIHNPDLTALSDKDRRQFENNLHQLEAEFRGLNLSKRFINF